MRWKLLALATTAALAAGCGDESGTHRANPDSGTSDILDELAGADAEDSADTADVFVGPAGCEELVNRRSLGSVALDQTGRSAPFTFTVPDCAHAFMLDIVGPDDVTFILDRLTGPDGRALISGPFPQGQLASPIRMTQGEGVGTALVPNSMELFQAGEYEAVVLGGRILGDGLFNAQFEPWRGTVQVELLVRAVDTLERGGTIDANVYMTGAGGLTRAEAESSALLQGALERLAEHYAQVGIALGEVTYFDIPERFRTITSISGADNMLSEMFALTGNGPPGLNFFLVQRFDVFGGLGAGIGGISGGLPGPALRTGSPRSGVAVAMAAIQGDSATLAHVMAHEGGHYLGLFHTSEFFGGEDPLSDTPTGQRGDTNLMYPAVGGGTQLTPQQGRVMHNHVEVRP
jgi:hypothetical protein